MEQNRQILEFKLSADQIEALKKISGDKGVRLTGEVQGRTVVFNQCAVNTSVLEMRFTPR